jgi:hypothetical protein
MQEDPLNPKVTERKGGQNMFNLNSFVYRNLWRWKGYAATKSSTET